MNPVDLVAFDVDGTLVHGPDGRNVWELLNQRYTGSWDCNRERYAAYLDGRITYPEWVDLDIGGWQAAGARRNEMLAVLGGLQLGSGVAETLTALQAAGVRLCAVSGTLDIVVETLLPDHPFDEVHCNRIRFGDDGRIVGWQATPFDMEGKATALRDISRRHGVPLARCGFVGDSSNDRWIAALAGRSVAYNPKSDSLIRAADVVVRDPDLQAILPHFLNRERPAG